MRPHEDPHAVTDPIRATIERALGAQYDVLHLIGRGGMGSVYLARERLLERLVAVKVLPHEAASDPAGRERFLREARTAARLSHPNIVPLHSFAEAEGTFLYVMGYVEGESLEARLQRDGRIPPAEARVILAQVADALHHAHQQGVVHRDVKPDNILLESDTGRALLTDFGIAKQGSAQGTLTRTGMVMGTPHYMSPEQASAEDVDGRSDIYALGVVGYRMISGRLPFEGGTLRALLLAQVARDPQPLIATDGDAAAPGAIMRALKKSPAERWPSARDFANALRPAEQEPELPDELAPMASLGTKMLFGLLALSGAMYTLHLYNPSDGLLQTLAAPFGVLALFTGSNVIRARRAGVTAADALRMLFWAPATWWGWWPRSLRRPGDLWPRLPAVMKRARAMLTAAFASFAGALVPSLGMLLAMVAGGHETNGTVIERIFFLSSPITAALLLGGVALTVGWGRRFRVTPHVAGRLTWEPTWNNARFWNRPDVAPLLQARAAPVSVPRTHHELVEGIARDVALLPDAQREGVRMAPEAARELARLVTVLDGEIAELAKHADPGERERLEQRIAAMPPLDDEPVARREVRELVAGQLQLLDRLELRRREVGDERERLLALLRTLWHQVASLRADADRDARGVADITGRVQAICDEVSRQRGAVRALPVAPTTPIPG